MRLEPGAALAGGRYRLDALRGRGGMAVVWAAHDTQLERPVAIKVIAESLAADPEFQRRFEREARAAAAVSHPHVVKLFDYGVEDERPYLIMEYVDGPNLAELAKEGGSESLDPERVAHDLLEALCHIHMAGVLHRDIKPANLLLTPAGELRVTDFGIARLDETTQITRAGMVVGTERYLAPEVAAGRPASPASDLYSCGAVLAELISATGGAPALRAFVDWLREEEPARRPQSAEEALERLRAGGGDEATAPLAAREPDEAPTARMEVTGGDEPSTARLAGPSAGAEPERGQRARPSRLQPAAGSLPSRRRSTAGSGPSRRHSAAGSGPSRLRSAATAVLAPGRGARLYRGFVPVAVIAAVAAVATAIVLLASGDEADRAAVPRPAPETAPAGEQLQRIEEIVRRIGEHQRP